MPYPLFRRIPPCPGDPMAYQLVERDHQFYWRLKRGSKKPARLNEALLFRSKVMRACSPFVKDLKEVLQVFMQYMNTPRLHQRMYRLIEQHYAEKAEPGFSKFKDFDFQAAHPLEALLKTNYHVVKTKDSLKLVVEAGPEPVEKHNSDITEFAFETMLVTWGEYLQVEQQVSPLYEIGSDLKENYIIERSLPEYEAWMLILKVSCFEGNEWARSGRHYGMKVVAVGDGREGENVDL